jgi:hypothetical protein
MLNNFVKARVRLGKQVQNATEHVLSAVGAALSRSSWAISLTSSRSL